MWLTSHLDLSLGTAVHVDSLAPKFASILPRHNINLQDALVLLPVVHSDSSLDIVYQLALSDEPPL